MPPTPPDPPSHFCCPITQMLMEDPVLAPDGNSYDRDPLERWARERTPPRLPLTNLPFNVSQLVPNRSLRDAIDDWKVQVGLAAPTPNPDRPPPAAAPPATAAPAGDDLPPWAPLSVHRQALTIQGSNLHVVVADSPHDIHTQRPLHVVVVMDVSGSMSVPATKRNAAGENEIFANCVLDLVKYAALAVSHMLNKHDFFSLVTYSDSAALVLDHVPGDSWSRIASTVDRIKPSGATNMGSGFRQALDCVVRHTPPSTALSGSQDVLSAVLLLTDGAPNTGLNGADMLRSFSRVHAAAMSRTIINTYAFGYADDLASELMFEIATKGNGCFSYIPDVGFLGTVFIHALANLRSVVAVIPEGGVHAVSCGQVRSGIAEVDFDTQRTMPTDITQNCAASSFQVPRRLIGTVNGPVTSATVRAALEGKDFGPVVTPELLNRDILRSLEAQKVCDCILRCIAGEVGAPSEAVFYALLESASVDLDSIPHIPFDLEQQVAPAFRPEYYRRWGKHYLLSFVSAHLNQLCNNFKDKSIAGYKSPFVAEKHDRYDDIFNMLEPPRPTDLAPATLPRYQQQRSSAALQARTTITHTQQFNNRRDPCVHEDSQVRMADGSLRCAKDVRPGDKVATVCGVDVLVSHVIRTQCKGGSAELVCFPPPSFADGFYGGDNGGLRITPWHPVYTKEVSRSGSSRGPATWKLPCDTGFAVRTWKCEHLYSFCVRPTAEEGGSSTSFPVGYEPAMMIDGIAVVHLAHGRSDPPLLCHPFFGTRQVLAQLPKGKYIHTFAPEPVLKDDDEDEHGVLKELGIVPGAGLACAWDLHKLVSSE